MPIVQPTAIAVLISDLHLSLIPPACRADKDWMETQARYLLQLKEVANHLPILFSGDLFDKWNAPPELINFALEYLPDGMICVPGQHDLPLHRMDLMHRSGYGVLKKVQKISDIAGTSLVIRGGFDLHGFGWEQEITPVKPIKQFRRIVLVHRYVWMKGKSYPGAAPETNITALIEALRGYDIAVTGDNHTPFEAHVGNCLLYNCGTFIRRKSDEIPYVPSLGILYSDGSIQRKKLDTSQDRFHKAIKDRPEVPFNMKDFIEGLEGLGEHGLDFRAAVKQHLETEDVPPKVKEIILTALGEA